MSNASAVYHAAMHGVLGPGWWTAWPLSTRLAAGDICKVADGQLLRMGSLKSLGVKNATRTSPYRDHLTYDSDGTVEVKLKASAETGPLFQALASADGGAHLAFSRDRSVFAVFARLGQTEMKEPYQLARQLTELYFRQEWEPDWVAVTHVLAAEAATVLIASASDAEAELRVAAEVSAAGVVKVADLAGNVQLARGRSVSLEWGAGEATTPFCRVAGLRKSWSGKVDADFAPRQKVKGLAPAAIPVKLIEQAEQRPDEVISEVLPPDGA